MKNILVTGIKQGLGLQVTKALLEQNYKVFGVALDNNADLDGLKKEYRDRLIIIITDLADIEGSIESIFTRTLGFHTPLHGFVNNAAIAYDDIISNLNYEPLQRMYQINVFSPFMLTKHVIRNMLLHNIQGSIVHISSISVHTGYKGLAMYASTKGALEAFSRTTAREWGERGIRSNCLVAGFMETGMSAPLSTAQKDRIFKRTSLKKPTELASVANMVEYLLSDKSRSVTGSNVFVDSGTI
ncbi:MAG TPA: SDR family oxidoreductase [bacterium]|nr:SDR family oxidoreductase [bacterium]HQI48038.1 SDR family oxidoreductase [bacterium]HQJ66506.1 SDR family oxidoreductase [bacterium]